MLPRWESVTAPAFSAPDVERQVTDLLGTIACISASHSLAIGPIWAFQCSLLSPVLVTDSTCFMNEGKLSKSVHMLYTLSIGALMVRSFSTRICYPPLYILSHLPNLGRTEQLPCL